MLNVKTQHKKRDSKAIAEDDFAVKHGRLFEAILSLFQHDILAKSEFYSPPRQVRLMGEWNLRYALLEDAIMCFQKSAHSKSPRARARHEEARAWIFGEEFEDYLLSFRNVCSLLGFDRSYIRRGLSEWL